MGIPSDCYIVACARSDGALPKPEKLFDDLIFFDTKEAQDFLWICQEMAPMATIYKCHIEVIEQCQPNKAS